MNHGTLLAMEITFTGLSIYVSGIFIWAYAKTRRETKQ